MSSRLSKVLFTNRITPQSTTGLTPAELMLGRRPHTRVDLLKPNTAERVERRQERQKAQHDSHGQSRTFRIGDPIFLKNFTGSGWLPGKIVETTGPVSFVVLLEDGRRKRCHQDQIRARVVGDGPPEMSEIAVETGVETSGNPIELSQEQNHETPQPDNGPAQLRVPEPANDTRTPPTGTNDRRTPPIDTNVRQTSQNGTNVRRYPRRQRKQRDIFQPGKDWN